MRPGGGGAGRVGGSGRGVEGRGPRGRVRRTVAGAGRPEVLAGATSILRDRATDHHGTADEVGRASGLRGAQLQL